jgi:predicted GH43/DUF377 family glycosyl hydrolase
MRWVKKGLLYGPNGKHPWARHSALQPTPYLMRDGAIRMFVGFRDSAGVSRIGFVDLDGANPSRVLRVSGRPVLDTGAPGTFDENGVVPCAVVEREGQLWLFYAGYQLGQKVKFYAFGGLAISDNGGESFRRFSLVPINDRTDDELFFRVIHTMMLDDDGRWRAWYGAGSEFDKEGERQFPCYDIRHAGSPDGIHLDRDYKVCVDVGAGEYRVGRPYVIKCGEVYKMFFSAGTKTEGFRLAYAESPDGVNWTRNDASLVLEGPGSDWDSRMQAYPSVVSSEHQTYLFYNGNNYGEAGFGYAVLEK